MLFSDPIPTNKADPAGMPCFPTWDGLAQFRPSEPIPISQCQKPVLRNTFDLEPAGLEKKFLTGYTQPPQSPKNQRGATEINELNSHLKKKRNETREHHIELLFCQTQMPRL